MEQTEELFNEPAQGKYFIGPEVEQGTRAVLVERGTSACLRKRPRNASLQRSHDRRVYGRADDEWHRWLEHCGGVHDWGVVRGRWLFVQRAHR